MANYGQAPPLQPRALREEAAARAGTGLGLKTMLFFVGLFVAFVALLWLLDILS